MTKTIFSVFQIFLSVILVFLVIIQSKGKGLGNSFLTGASLYSTKRGVEKVIFKITIVLAITFFISSIIQVVIK